jgi:hypothetical protein
MPASISPTEFPEMGIECNEFVFLPAPCEDKDKDSLILLQGPPVSCQFEKPGSVPDSLSSGATTPGEESELEDQSEYEFNADGQREYYDFLREMGCDFKPAPEEKDGDDDELDEESMIRFTPEGQEEYYDFLREMGCPLDARATGADEEDEEEWETETEEEVWNDSWNESTASSAHRSAAHSSVASTGFICSVASKDPMLTPDCNQSDKPCSEDANGHENQAYDYDDDDDSEFGIGQRFRPHTNITPGPSLFLQKALWNVAEQRKRNTQPNLF